jgi:hypothetical protein
LNRNIQVYEAALLGLGLLLIGCRSPRAEVEPSIEFTVLPPAGEGNPFKSGPIEGRVRGAKTGGRIVLFARSGVWWVQPTADHPFKQIQPDFTWKSSTHPGSAYAALLVTAAYRPPTTLAGLPEKGGAVLAVATAEGASLSRPAVKILHFSGYDWEVRRGASNRGGTTNLHDPANALIDANGFLHLRIARQDNAWTSSEVKLTRSLGYGSYRFVVRDVSQLEPAVVFSMFTWDESTPPREMDIEISRWGEESSKNAQYVVQPYYVPANVVRFVAPRGVLTHWVLWEPGRVSFRTVPGASSSPGTAVGGHVFTSGVPAAGNEEIHINIYVYDNKHNPLRHDSEVIIEKFEYLP